MPPYENQVVCHFRLGFEILLIEELCKDPSHSETTSNGQANAPYLILMKWQFVETVACSGVPIHRSAVYLWTESREFSF